LISISSNHKERLEKINLTDLEVTFLGYGDNYIAVGDLKGNEFIITVRNLEEKNIKKFEKKSKTKIFPNYFGEQRFSEKNADIGKAIIHRNFEKAATLLKLDIMDNNDYIGAIRKFNKKLLRLYIHAYQSLIFNKTIKEYLKTEKQQQKIPIIGFGTELEKYPEELQKIIKDILQKENITERDFITVKMPELSEEGSERNLLTEIENLEVIEKEDNKIKIKFFLKKGCYATEAIKYLLT